MIRILIICAFCGAGTLTCNAQTLEVMAEQLVALQTLQQTTSQGYRLETTGIQNIGEITNGEYQLHQTFFGSLAAVNPALTADPKIIALRNLQNVLVQQINAQISYWQQQQQSTIIQLP